MNAYRAFLSLGALLALGCGGDAVDVGHSQNRGWSDAPMEGGSASQPIYESDEAMFSFALDGDTLHALVHHNDTLELVSCELERCRTKRKVLFSDLYVEETGPNPTALVISGGWLYWIADGHQGNGVAACPVAGCMQPRVVPTAIASNLAADSEGGVYWINRDQSALMHLAAEAQAPEHVRSLPIELRYNADIAVHEDYVYVSADNEKMSRFRRDGAGEVEPVATDEMLSSFTLTNDSIYYASQILTGRIVQCPLTGCAEGSDTVVGNQRWPEAIQVDGSEAFWLTNPRFSQKLTHASLQSCLLPDCTVVNERVSDLPATEIVDYQPQSPRFGVNQQSIVWLESFRADGSRLRRLAR
jgi:hypothetical protein